MYINYLTYQLTELYNFTSIIFVLFCLLMYYVSHTFGIEKESTVPDYLILN